MENNFYYVVGECKDNKYCAYTLRVGGAENLVAVMGRLKDAISVNACKTKKEADRITAEWNKAYKNNGTYMF